MLKQLQRVLVQFSPWTGEGRSAREFLSRLQTVKAQASNPDCKIESRIRVKGSNPQLFVLSNPLHRWPIWLDLDAIIK